MPNASVTISVRCGEDVVTETGTGSTAVAAGIACADELLASLGEHRPPCPTTVADVEAFKAKLEA